MYDIYLITKYYYPEVTFKMIVETLLLFVKIKGFNVSYCNTVEKYVFYTGQISVYNNYQNILKFSKDLTMQNLINYFNEKQKSNVS